MRAFQHALFYPEPAAAPADEKERFAGIGIDHLYAVPVSGSTTRHAPGLYGRFSSAPRHRKESRKSLHLPPGAGRAGGTVAQHPAPQGRFTATTVTPGAVKSATCMV